MNDPKALIALLWEQATPPKRGPRPTLTLDAIAKVGIELADAEGLGAVTMQRVAERLGVTKMALYRYVPGKAELVALMIDVGVGTPTRFRARPKAWRPALAAWSHALFERFYQHPWSFGATLGARVFGPNELLWVEYAVAALDGTPLDGAEKLDVAVTLLGHVRNVAQQLTAIRTEKPEHAAQTKFAALLRGREERFPALSAALASKGASGSRGQALEFGLQRILDGVGALIASRKVRARGD